MDPAIPASSLLSVSQLSYFSANSRSEASASTERTKRVIASMSASYPREPRLVADDGAHLTISDE